MIGRKFYDINMTMFACLSIGFKWEIGCTVPEMNNKSNVRAKTLLFTKKVTCSSKLRNKLQHN